MVKGIVWFIGMAVAIIGLLAVSFLCVSGLVYFICWGFGFPWSWQLCIGVYALILLLRGVFQVVVKTKE